MLLAGAFSLKLYQISGPSWMDTERYDITARAPDGTTTETVRKMMQTLLIERFGMKIHREDQVRPVYVLEVAKGGFKLKPAEDADPASADRTRFSTNGHMEAKTLGSLANMLSAFMDRPVLDRTGLTGLYNISLDVSPEDLAGFQRLKSARHELDDSGATPVEDQTNSVFSALKDLGLRLSARKMPVETLVVDHAEKIPTEN
jgi:uncharacterized protein (TIGR03435 family)